MKSLVLILAVVGFSTVAYAMEVETAYQTDSTLEVFHDCNANQMISGKAAVFSQSHNFRCDFNDEYRAKRLSEENATAKCYREGYVRCITRISHITESGYLGYQPDFGKSLGYGCIAETIVRGEN